MALPTHGRVLLDTTAGDIDIELWSKVRARTVAMHCELHGTRRKRRKHAGISLRWPWKVRTSLSHLAVRLF